MMTHSLLSLNMVLMVVMVMNSPIDTFEEQNYRRFDPFFYGEGTRMVPMATLLWLTWMINMTNPSSPCKQKRMLYP
jgi:hypothetical protein